MWNFIILLFWFRQLYYEVKVVYNCVFFIVSILYNLQIGHFITFSCMGNIKKKGTKMFITQMLFDEML